MTRLAAIDGKILLTRCRERVCRGQEDRLPPAGQAPPRSLDVRAILNIGLQHRSFTSLSPNGPSSEKASDADFDCAWGEKMRIGTEEVGPSQGCRLGHGLRRVSLWAGESGVSRLGLQYAVRRDRWPSADGKSLRQASPRQLPSRHPGTIAAISPFDTHRHGRFPSPIYVSECKSRFLRRRRAWKRR